MLVFGVHDKCANVKRTMTGPEVASRAATSASFEASQRTVTPLLRPRSSALPSPHHFGYPLCFPLHPGYRRHAGAGSGCPRTTDMRPQFLSGQVVYCTDPLVLEYSKCQGLDEHGATRRWLSRSYSFGRLTGCCLSLTAAQTGRLLHHETLHGDLRQILFDCSPTVSAERTSRHDRNSRLLCWLWLQLRDSRADFSRKKIKRLALPVIFGTASIRRQTVNDILNHPVTEAFTTLVVVAQVVALSATSFKMSSSQEVPSSPRPLCSHVSPAASRIRPQLVLRTSLCGDDSNGVVLRPPLPLHLGQVRLAGVGPSVTTCKVVAAGMGHRPVVLCQHGDRVFGHSVYHPQREPCANFPTSPHHQRVSIPKNLRQVLKGIIKSRATIINLGALLLLLFFCIGVICISFMGNMCVQGDEIVQF
eukprot:752624-Hanusia_phi.AAC.1